MRKPTEPETGGETPESQMIKRLYRDMVDIPGQVKQLAAQVGELDTLLRKFTNGGAREPLLSRINRHGEEIRELRRLYGESKEHLETIILAQGQINTKLTDVERKGLADAKHMDQSLANTVKAIGAVNKSVEQLQEDGAGRYAKLTEMQFEISQFVAMKRSIGKRLGSVATVLLMGVLAGGGVGLNSDRLGITEPKTVIQQAPEQVTPEFVRALAEQLRKADAESEKIRTVEKKRTKPRQQSPAFRNPDDQSRFWRTAKKATDPLQAMMQKDNMADRALERSPW